MEIKLDTKIYDLLKEYPFLEDELIKINPKFKKLKNPVLRRTVTRIASIRQAARVGGMDPIDLLNRVREKVGQPPLQMELEGEEERPAPEWITREPVAILDADELLEKGENPLTRITKLLREMEEGDVLLLLSSFRPEPLIGEMEKRGFPVYSSEAEGRHYTYILKK
ncbi:MAG: DUF1858 domain-containing protein [Epsilonproteobacteria bacterium]|nr:hypothetical protein [Campylobacterota bacterium]NPA56264.1 DUF1858 domain-containing protein [Campylobacterota bacterium]